MTPAPEPVDPAADDDLARVASPPTILIYAARYALGRQTYAVSDVAGAVARCAGLLGESERAAIVRDIEAADQAYAGELWDRRTWLALRDRLAGTERGDGAS